MILARELFLAHTIGIWLLLVRAFAGATLPWTTYEAENMVTTGKVLGPEYAPNHVASESSGRRCVQLDDTGQYVEFVAQGKANAMVVRYSTPDSSDGKGNDSTISLYHNGKLIRKLALTSKYSWLYGTYPFTNAPELGSPRNFYEETRVSGLHIEPGDVLRLQKDAGDTALYYIIDLVDLENVAPPLNAPTNSLSVTDYGATGNGISDDTAALRNCIAVARAQRKSVWLPPGTYKITGRMDLPSNITIQGAGMWHTTLVGDPLLYTNPAHRITLNGNGSNIHLADFAIVGRLNYRNDTEPNDGLGGSYGTGSRISRVWVEHTKAGAWIVNSLGLIVDGCRFRNTIADGINLCVGTRSCVITNCSARGTGDDCFAIWPATYTAQTYVPGLNLITHCTGQLPFLGNGGAIYGGADNRIEDCTFMDVPYGCGILLSTTFPVGPNAFSGTTVTRRTELVRCGGYDPGWGWRAAVQLCLDHGSISGVELNTLNITDSISDGLSIIAPGSNPKTGLGTLSNATAAFINIPNYGIGVKGRHGLWARSDAIGRMTVSNSAIAEFRNDSTNFTFSFVTSTVNVTIQTDPPGRTFSVDNTNYTGTQTFSWQAGSSHTLATTSPQEVGPGIRYVWRSWSDGGAISHTIRPLWHTNYVAHFGRQFYLTMVAEHGGAALPGNGWYDSGALVDIAAAPSNGFAFVGWTGTGPGSYSGTNNPATISMEGPITQAARFEKVGSRVISLSGDLAFGNVVVGNSTTRTLTIGNAGDAPLVVSNIVCPDGFNAVWSGTILPGSSTNIEVTFSPTVATNYSGFLVVNSDATSGDGAMEISGTGVEHTVLTPAPITILAVKVNPEASVTLTYTTTPNLQYHVESTPDFFPPVWEIIEGSFTNATGAVVTFTDTNAIGSSQRFYRVVSP